MKKITSYLLACLMFIIGVSSIIAMIETKDLFYDIIGAIVGSICLSPAIKYWYDRFLNS